MKHNETLFRIVVQFLQSFHVCFIHVSIYTCCRMNFVTNYPDEPSHVDRAKPQQQRLASQGHLQAEALMRLSTLLAVFILWDIFCLIFLFESFWGPFSKLVSRHQDMSSYLRRTRMHHMHHTLRTQSPLRALKSQAWAPVSSTRYQIGFQRSRMIQKGEEMNNEWEIKKRSEQKNKRPLSSLSHFHPAFIRWSLTTGESASSSSRSASVQGRLAVELHAEFRCRDMVESFVDRSEMEIKSNLLIRSLPGYGFKVQHQRTCDILWYLLGGHLV